MADAVTVLVTGQQDCTRERFDQYYAPAIECGIKKGWHFIMGAADGVDKMAAELLLGKGSKNVSIYDKDGKDGNGALEKGWELNAWFKSYPDRDYEMCRDADQIIVYLFDAAAPTGTFCALLEFVDMHTEYVLSPQVIRELARACQRDTEHSSKTWIVDKPTSNDFAYLKKLFVAAEESPPLA